MLYETDPGVRAKLDLVLLELVMYQNSYLIFLISIFIYHDKMQNLEIVKIRHGQSQGKYVIECCYVQV